LLFLAIDYIINYSFCLFSRSSSRECILEMWHLRAAILCSMVWLEKKLIVVSVVVGFRYMSISSLVCLHNIVMSRKSMELCSSHIGLNFMLFCILCMYVLIECELIFVVSNKRNIRCTKKKISWQLMR